MNFVCQTVRLFFTFVLFFTTVIDGRVKDFEAGKLVFETWD